VSAGAATVGRGGLRAALAAAGLQALLLSCARFAPGAAPGRERDPAAWAFAALWILWSAGEAGLALPGREPRRLAGSDRALAALTGAALLTGAWLGLWARPVFAVDPWWPAAAAGLAAGAALRLAALRRLGPGFVTGTVAGPDRPLVTDGVYRRLRHPSEAGLVLAALAGALLLRSPAALALSAAVVLPTAVLRAHREDQALAAAHQEAHAAWRRRAGMLWPRGFRRRA
jgi:protein-S-isoprenylcysteine O-methyltransferase Ste14